jgi:hypothetical protein
VEDALAVVGCADRDEFAVILAAGMFVPARKSSKVGDAA